MLELDHIIQDKFIPLATTIMDIEWLNEGQNYEKYLTDVTSGWKKYFSTLKSMPLKATSAADFFV